MLKKHRKLTMVFSLLLLAALLVLMASGLRLVPPNTALVYYKAMGYENGIIYKPAVKFNSFDGHKLYWIGPAPFGKTSARVSQDTQFTYKIPMWIDRETGEDAVVALIISGTLRVKDWDKFAEKNDPRSKNASRTQKDVNAPELGIIDFWKTDGLGWVVNPTVDTNWRFYINDIFSRYSLVENIIKERGIQDKDGVEKYLKINLPWVWLLGPGAYSYVSDGMSQEERLMAIWELETLLQGDSAMSAEEKNSNQLILMFYKIVEYDKLMADFPLKLGGFISERNSFYTVTRPEFITEAQKIFSEFKVYLAERKINLLLLEETNFRYLLDSFLEEKIYPATKTFVFKYLALYEWRAENLLLKREVYEKEFKEIVLPFFLKEASENHYPVLKIKEQMWPMVIEKALADLGDRHADVLKSIEKITDRFFGESDFTKDIQRDLERELRRGEVWEVRDLLVEAGKFSWFLQEGRIDPDFYDFYKYKNPDGERS